MFRTTMSDQQFPPVSSGVTKTDNGAISHKGTDSACLNLFSNVTAREKGSATSDADIRKYLQEAWNEDQLTTFKIIAYKRDCRGGAGEKHFTVVALQWLAELYPAQVTANMEAMIEYGYWKDLLITWTGTKFQHQAMKLFARQLQKDKNILDQALEATNESEAHESDHESEARVLLGQLSLASKYAPTEGCSFDKLVRKSSGEDRQIPPSSHLANLLCGDLHFRHNNVMKAYRTEYLTPLRDAIGIVEKLLCAQQWDTVAERLSKVPSRALAMYSKKCFPSHLGEKFKQWQRDVLAGRVKANVSQVDPYEVVSRVAYLIDPHFTGLYDLDVSHEELPGLEIFYQLQVEKLRKAGKLNALTVVDVSGSMHGTPLMVAIALGIWTSSVCTDAFRDLAVTFSSTPSWIDMSDCTSLYDRIEKMAQAEWGMSTNLQATFDLILSKALQCNLPQSEMPGRLFIISDMQFDDCGSHTNLETIRAKYRNHGYDMPEVVFWNVSGTAKDSSATKDENGIALVSGWSKDILNLFLDAEPIPSPYELMLKAINNPRYDPIKVALDTCNI